MTSLFARALVAVGVLSAVTIGIAGCTPAPSAGGSGTSHTTAPTHSAKPTKPKPTLPPALDTTAPAALLNLPCTTLVPSADIAEFQGAATLISPPSQLAAGDLADPTNYLPISDYIRQAGGIDCIWSTGPVDHNPVMPDNVSAHIEVTVQFNAAAAWATFANGDGTIGDDVANCDSDEGNTAICQEDRLVGTTWIEVFSRKSNGPKVLDGPDAIMAAAVAAVKAAGTPSAPTTTEAGTLPLGGTCTSFATTAQVQSALGVSSAMTTAVLVTQPNYPAFYATWLASENTLNDHPCAFEAGGKVQALLTWIPGGAWAWAENNTQTLADGAPQPLTVTGLKANDTANIRCATGKTSCVVDLVLGGNWIEATVPSSSTAANKQTAVTALAQDIINTVG